MLDMDETLMHYMDDPGKEVFENGFNVRPYVQEFLMEMARYYEIVVFTAAT